MKLKGISGFIPFLLLMITISFKSNLIFSQWNFTLKPEINKSFMIKYNPKENNIIENPQELSAIYTFDYWDMPFSKSISDSLLIIKCMNSERKKTVEMRKKGEEWEAIINVPSSAKILSYIITDGKKYDLNNKRTYFDYIYTEKGKPVRESSLYMLQLFEFTKQTYSEQLAEVEKEIKNYPANFKAYYFYWKVLLYKNMFSKTIVNKIEQEMGELYSSHSQNPDVCETIAHVYTSGLLHNENIWKIVSGIPLHMYNEKTRGSIKSEVDSRLFKIKKTSFMNTKAPNFEATDWKGNKIIFYDIINKIIIIYYIYFSYRNERLFIKDFDSFQKAINTYNQNNIEVLCFYKDEATEIKKIRLKNFINSAKIDSIYKVYDLSKLISEKGYTINFLPYSKEIVDKFYLQYYEYCLVDKNKIVRFIGYPDRNDTMNLNQKIDEIINK